MNQEIYKMLSAYALGTHISAIHALKEIIQALTLHTLSKTDFFSHAAFYGDTALRIFHGLDRFSEDMDLPLFQRMTGTQEMYFALPYAGGSALCKVFAHFGKRFLKPLSDTDTNSPLPASAS
nr:nucleotidyl transferase AbiEii/AbiGii toxin family protein [uncultured Sphaerochaeta sp.]